MSISALIFIAIFVAGIWFLSRMPERMSVDRDLPRACLGLLLLAIGGVGAVVTGFAALVGGLL